MRVTPLPATESPQAWLRSRIEQRRAADALAPVTVALPSAGAALATRRTLGRSGTVNVHCTLLPRLAEELGAPRLASTGYSPLTPLMELAAGRHLLAQPAAGVIRSTTPHRAMVETLVASLRRLRQRDVTASDRKAIADRGQLPQTLIALLDSYETLLRDQTLYDGRDLLAAAAAAVLEGASLTDVGAVIVHMPLSIPPGHAQLLQALDGHTEVEVSLLADGPPEAVEIANRMATTLGHPAVAASTGRSLARAGTGCHLTTAPSAAEEVRLAVRRVLADCESGIPLHRMAILHGEGRIYTEPLRDVLAGAGLAATVIGGRPLADAHAARGLIGLLRLRSADFSRVAVVTWLASFPRRHPGVPHGPVWDRLSRKAGVVRGATNWHERMAKLATRCRADAASEDETRSEARQAALLHEAEDAEAIATLVASLDAATAAPQEPTWTTLAAWAARLLAEHVLDSHWASSQLEAGQVIAEMLAALPQADRLDPAPSVETLIDTLERLFESRSRPEGRLGIGIVVGTVASAAGMSFERVHVLGMTESAFPAKAAPDPFLPALGEADPFDDRAERVGAEALALATVCAGVEPGGALHLSTTIWDESDRPVYPSRWFVAEANVLAEERQTSAHVRARGSNSWMQAVPSPLAGMLTAPTPLNLAERRLRQGATWRAAGHHLGASPLAARVELPLQRALQIQRARRSQRLTGADGNLSDLHLDPGLGGDAATFAISSSRVQSASALQKWASCPYSYFLNRLLRVEATENPEDDDRWSLSPLHKGSAVHSILERFFGELIKDGRPAPLDPYLPGDRLRLRAIAEEELQQLEAEGLTGHPLVWSTARAGILADLETFLERDASERAGGGWRPTAVEQHFGYQDTVPLSWPALTISVSGDTVVQLRGRIDRLDLAPSPGGDPLRARVIDYKTGSVRPSATELAEDVVRGGTALQLALYARAVQAAHPELTTIEAAFWFISTKGGFELATVDIDVAATDRLDDVVRGIATGIAAGSFPQTPGGETFRPGVTSWDNCVYCPYDRICPSGRDSVQERKAADPAAQLHAVLAMPDADAGDDQ